MRAPVITITEVLVLHDCLKLESLVVSARVESNPRLAAACHEKGVELRSPRIVSCAGCNVGSLPVIVNLGVPLTLVVGQRQSE